jgi:hypothetical protein
VTNEFNGEPQVLISNLAQTESGHRFVTVRLAGTRSNRAGLGAKVTVVTDSTSHTQVLDGKSGYLSQSSLPLYFGLGDARRIEEIRVRWPSGTEQTLVDVDSNTTIVIAEPD